MQKSNSNKKHIIKAKRLNKKNHKVPINKKNYASCISRTLVRISIVSIIFMFLFTTTSFCATAKIVNRMEDALKTISKWIVKLATPVAAVSIGSGLLIKKFSFGDEERMNAGKKIIRSTIFSYAFILVIDLVLDAIKSIMT